MAPPRSGVIKTKLSLACVPCLAVDTLHHIMTQQKSLTRCQADASTQSPCFPGMPSSCWRIWFLQVLGWCGGAVLASPSADQPSLPSSFRPPCLPLAILRGVPSQSGAITRSHLVTDPPVAGLGLVETSESLAETQKVPLPQACQ